MVQPRKMQASVIRTNCKFIMFFSPFFSPFLSLELMVLLPLFPTGMDSLGECSRFLARRKQRKEEEASETERPTHRLFPSPQIEPTSFNLLSQSSSSISSFVQLEFSLRTIQSRTILSSCRCSGMVSRLVFPSLSFSPVLKPRSSSDAPLFCFLVTLCQSGPTTPTRSQTPTRERELSRRTRRGRGRGRSRECSRMGGTRL